jgi:hypothetical protein
MGENLRPLISFDFCVPIAMHTRYCGEIWESLTVNCETVKEAIMSLPDLKGR